MKKAREYEVVLKNGSHHHQQAGGGHYFIVTHDNMFVTIEEYDSENCWMQDTVFSNAEVLMLRYR